MKATRQSTNYTVICLMCQGLNFVRELNSELEILNFNHISTNRRLAVATPLWEWAIMIYMLKKKINKNIQI